MAIQFVIETLYYNFCNPEITSNLFCVYKKLRNFNFLDVAFKVDKTSKTIFVFVPSLQVNLFQKVATSAEHVVYQNCSECQNKTKTTICVHNMFCRYSELTIFMNNEQSVVILWDS